MHTHTHMHAHIHAYTYTYIKRTHLSCIFMSCFLIKSSWRCKNASKLVDACESALSFSRRTTEE